MKVILTSLALLVTVLLILFWGASAQSVEAATVLFPSGGGTGSSTLTGILRGDGQAFVKTLLLGSGLTFDGATLSATGGSGTVSTSSVETSGFVPFWTSTAGTPALLSGGVSGFVWNSAASRLTATFASSTAQTIGTLFVGSLDGALYGAGGQVKSISTSTPTVSAPITYSGTLGHFLSGVSGVFGCTNASSGVTGCLTGTDWSTFNAKQPAGNYVTALTGDVSASGPGSVAATLATVNSNVGSFTNANITVNGKGLITSASNGTSGGTGNIATSSSETQFLLPWWDSTNGTPALLNGGDSTFSFNPTDHRLTLSYASTTAISPTIAMFPKGTSLPSITFTGDLNTGLLSSGIGDDLQIVSGGNTDISFTPSSMTGLVDLIFNSGSGGGQAYIESSPGTVSSPSYTFRGDQNTGMWSDTTNEPDTVNFSTGGLNRFSIRTSGASTTAFSAFGPVYIGTTSTTTLWGNATSSFSGGVNVTSGGLSIGNISGFLKATAGAVATSLINLTSDVTGTLSIANGGTGTTTAPVSQLLYGGSGGTYQSVATTSASCSGSVSCSGFTVIGASPITLTGSGLTSYDAFTHPAAGQSATTSLMLFNGNASSTQFSAYTAYFGGTATSTFTNAGRLGILNTSPSYPLDVAGFINTDQFSGYKQAGATILTASTTNGNTAVGNGALANYFSSASAGETAVGFQALGNATSTSVNTAVGYQAMKGSATNFSGVFNTAIGYQPLLKVSTGRDNVAIGAAALQNINTGGGNLAIGTNALVSATSSSNNVVIGKNAMLLTIAGPGPFGGVDGGDYNVALGAAAMFNNTVGYFNMAVGANALSGNTSGHDNIGFGFGAGSLITTGSQNIVFGSQTQAPSNTADGQLNIGNYIFGKGGNSIGNTPAGNVGIGTTTPWRTLSVTGTVAFDGITTSTAGNAVCILGTKDIVTAGNTTCVTSSKFTKHDIRILDVEKANEELAALRPVQYVNNKGGDTRYGLVAEEVNIVDPKLVEIAQSDITLDGHEFKKGDVLSVDYQRSVVGLLIAGYQFQNKEIESIKSGGYVRSVEENWQWFAIALLVMWNLFITFRRNQATS